MPIIIAPYFFNFASIIYLTTSLLMTIYYIFICYNLFKENNSKISNAIARKSVCVFYILFIYNIFDATNRQLSHNLMDKKKKT